MFKEPYKKKVRSRIVILFVSLRTLCLFFNIIVNEDTGLEEVDDTDGLDEQAEYEEWKLRELRRIKRDKEEKLEYVI